MNVVDLFSGLGGWSAAFEDHGDNVFTVDWEPEFKPDLVADIRAVRPEHFPFNPDIILASPPCEKFSVMTIGRYWNKDNTPKDPLAEEAVEMVKSALQLIEELSPVYWIMENPVGKLRKLDFMQDFERRTITYCKFGFPYRKGTDLWGVFPPSLELPEPCQNGSPCHIATARGSKIGIQENNSTGFQRLFHPPTIADQDRYDTYKAGSTKFRGGLIEDMARFSSKSVERKRLRALRAMIPYKLSEMVHEAVERDINA